MKVGIVGAGLVGATSAFALVLRGAASEVVLVDARPERAAAEADDILHAVPFASPAAVRAGDPAELAGARVVVIAAGVAQRPGESRLELLGRNQAVFRAVVPDVLAAAPDAILLIATNPVDVMTHLAARIAGEHGVEARRVIGSGTTLDTARFRTLLGRRLGIDARHVHAYVLGEHGDSEVLAWSAVTVAGMPLEEFCRRFGCAIGTDERAAIDEQVRRAAYRIIAGKGATYYGVAGALAHIVRAVTQDRRALLTVCTPLPRIGGVEDVTVSLPHVVGGGGVLRTVEPLLDDNEREALSASARVVRGALDGLAR